MGVARVTALTGLILLLLAPMTPFAPEAYAGPMVKVLVTFDPTVFKESVIAELGGSVTYRSKLANILAAEIPQEAVAALSQAPGVIRVSIDSEATASDTVPWGVSYVDAPTVWNTTGVTGFIDINGDGVGDIEVAVIDTGVDPNHPDLADNVSWCVSTIGGALSSACTDGNGHGTHVAGTIAALLNGVGVVGVAPTVEIYAIKALDDQGSGSFSDIIAAIEAAVIGPDGVLDADGDGIVVGDPDDDAAEVINMSLGGPSAPPELQSIIQQVYSLGVVVVAAAGNEGATQPAYPARYPEVIAVGAIDSSERVPWWSNDYPEVAAPGVDVLSTLPGGQYGAMSGTSMASPHIAAIAALVQAARAAAGLPLLPPGTFDDMTNTTVRGVLHLAAKDLGPAGYDRFTGYGAVIASQAVELALRQMQRVELVTNGGFDSDASGWSFYPGDFIDYAAYRSNAANASGVIEISGDVPSWQGSVRDYAFIGQTINVPSTASGTGTIEVTFYFDSARGDLSLVVAIYDTANNSFVWYDIIAVDPADYGQWLVASITVPADTIGQIAGGSYLFLVGLRLDTYTLWSGDWALMYVDSVSFTVNA